jgi:hypothetical protein
MMKDRSELAFRSDIKPYILRKTTDTVQIAEGCNHGCHIGSEDSYGSLWYPTSYNYTDAVVVVIVNRSTGQTSTAAIFEVQNKTAAFQSASSSLVASNTDLRGALIVDGNNATFFGTEL